MDKVAFNGIRSESRKRENESQLILTRTKMIAHNNFRPAMDSRQHRIMDCHGHYVVDGNLLSNF